jgi:Mn-containing catalase
VANIAAEEFGHIELVAETINSMLTGASPATNGDGSISGVMSDVKDARNAQQFITGRPRSAPPGLQRQAMDGRQCLLLR